MATVTTAGGASGTSEAQGNITRTTDWYSNYSMLMQLETDYATLDAIVLELEQTLTPKTQGEHYDSNREDL